jgi:hypothetical protein
MRTVSISSPIAALSRTPRVRPFVFPSIDHDQGFT